MDFLDTIKNGNVTQKMEDFLKENPNWPRAVYGASVIPACLLMFKKSEFSTIKMSISCLGLGAAAQMTYLGYKGEIKHPRKYTENDLLDNKSLILASAVNFLGYGGGAAPGFVFSYLTLGWVASSIGFRYFCSQYPYGAPEPKKK